MQRNRRMNALTSKLWFGGQSYVTFYPLPPVYRALHMCRHIENASSVHVWLAGYPDILLPLWNATCKSQIRSPVCTLRNSNMAITSLVCTLRNSNCTIQVIIQITHFALMWKQSTMDLDIFVLHQLICQYKFKKKTRERERKITPSNISLVSKMGIIYLVKKGRTYK